MSDPYEEYIKALEELRGEVRGLKSIMTENLIRIVRQIDEL